MDAYNGPAVLRWRANSSFAVECEVTAHVRSTGSGWEVTVDAEADDDHWGLNTLPNPWQLVFPDGSCFEVAATPIGVDAAWTLTEASSPP